MFSRPLSYPSPASVKEVRYTTKNDYVFIRLYPLAGQITRTESPK